MKKLCAPEKRPLNRSNDRMDSWKDIARYLNRNVRTLHRWEKEEGLPVHRHLHKSRSTLYAYKSEIDNWLRLRHPGPKQERSEHAVRQRSLPIRNGAGISLAVLPLHNLSGDPEDDYFADGMTEAVLTELGKISAFRVISRQSVMQYKGIDKPLSEIASELKVDLLLEGCVLRVNDQVRISAQLIKVVPEQHLWAESYERDMKSVLELQSQVARTIAAQVKVTLTPQDEARVTSAGPVDPEAYKEYLKGRYHLNRWTEDGLQRGVEHFNKALDIDPKFAPAFAGLADCYTFLNLYTHIPTIDACPKAKQAARKAVDLDAELAEGHTALGLISFHFDWDWFGAEREFQCAMELNPNSSHALVNYALYLVQMGRFSEAIAANERAIELDPLNYTTSLNLAWIYFHARHYDEAIAQLERTRGLDPDLYFAYAELAWNYAKKGMCIEAITACEACTALPHSQDDQIVIATLGWAYAVCGRRAVAIEFLDRLMMRSRQGWISPYHVAVLFAGLGENAEALEWLEKAYEERSPWLPCLEMAPWFDSLRREASFQAMLERMEFPGSS